MKILGLLVLLVVLVLVAPAPSLAFKSRPATPIHERITESALSFLSDGVLSAIIFQHFYVDFPGASSHWMDAEWHFDDCRFEESTENINELYDEALVNLNPDDPDLEDAQDAFGQLLHPVQDFYAHSNWVELREANLLDDELIDDGVGFWTVLKPFGRIKGVIVVQGEEDDIPAGFSLHRAGSIVTVVTPTESPPGLISGYFDISPLDPDDCPNNIDISHNDLNKDEPGRHPNGLPRSYSAAWTLARKQTTREWCRLLNLVSQAYGQTGVDLLFDNWVANEREAISVCFNVDAEIVFVDQSFSGLPQLGTSDHPISRFKDGANAVRSGGTVMISPGHYPAAGNYAKPMILRAPSGGVVLDGAR